MQPTSAFGTEVGISALFGSGKLCLLACYIAGKSRLPPAPSDYGGKGSNDHLVSKRPVSDNLVQRHIPWTCGYHPDSSGTEVLSLPAP